MSPPDPGRPGEPDARNEARNEPDARDDHFATRLEALHDAIARGPTSASPPAPVGQPATPDADRFHADRLHKAQNCLRLIERVRRQGDSTPGRNRLGSDTWPPADPADPAVAAAAAAPHRIGRFQIVRRLGEGGNGVVFLANDPHLNRQVAVKVPRPEALLSDDWRRRFVREAEAAAALDHRHIVRVLEAQRVGAVCYIASVYCEGIALSDWLAQRRPTPVPPRPAARLALALAEAVQHAHGRGVLHRDIKPSNVLLESPCADAAPITADRLADKARLTDFGLARFLHDDSEATRSGAIIGTPAYMAPEQADGLARAIDVRTDVYALGMLLYELLTLEAPFRRETAVATLQAVRLQEPPRLNRAGVPVPPDLEAICLKCLEKEKTKRYPTAAALAEDLRNFIENRPVTARRIGMAGRLGRWARRRPAIAALTGAVAVLGLALTVGASVAAVWLGESRREALDHLEKAILEKHKANQSEHLAMQTLFEARLAQARAVRHSGLPGRRLESLASLKHAAGLLAPLGLGEQERRELRNEAIASWSLADLDWTQGEITMPRGEGVGWDRDVEHHLAEDREAGVMVVTNFAAKKVVARLPIPKNHFADLRTVIYSPDQEYIAVKLSSARPPDKVQVWKRDGTTVLPPTDVSPGPALPFDFSPDGKWLALACPDSRVRVLTMPKLTVVKEWTDWFHPVTLRFSPDSKRLAVRRGDHVEIRDAVTGEVLRHFSLPRFIFRLAWSPDGRFLAAACHDQKVHIWRTDTGQLHTILAGHAAAVVDVHFHPGGRLLASTAWDGTTRLWNYRSSEQLVRAEGACAHFSRDGRRLGGDCGRWEVITDGPFASVHQPRAPNSNRSLSGQFHIHPDGRLLVASNPRQWSLWDTATGRVLAVRDGTWARFDAAGAHLLTGTGYNDLVRVPIQRRENDDEIVYTLGKPQHLADLKLGLSGLDAASGTMVVIPNYTATPVLVDSSSGKVIGKLAAHCRGRWVDVSADGRLAATGSWHGADVLIHDLEAKKVLHRLPAGSARVRFSPNGKTLAVGQIKEYSFWTADSAKFIRRIERSAAASVPGVVAFSPDGRLICICPDNHLLCLIDAKTFDELARLPLPDDQFISALTFTPDGVRLLAGTEAGGLHLFDLRLLRSRLAKLGLDWPGAPFADAAETIAKARVEIAW